MKIPGAFVIRFFDVVLALVFLPAALVVFILLIPPQLIMFGRLFHVSRRIGKHGRPFVYVKLKSMYDRAPGSGASESNGPESGVPGSGLPGDRAPGPSGEGRAHLEAGRIPPWGKFLRAGHFDEIPELVFILGGRESFVGPRPLFPSHFALVDSPWRRKLKPGWTGLSQLFLKKKGILPSRIQRRLDAKLGREFSPVFYLKILAATAGVYFSRPGQAEPGPTVAAYREAVQRGNNGQE